MTSVQQIMVAKQSLIVTVYSIDQDDINQVTKKTCFSACDSFFTEKIYGSIFWELWATSGEFKNRISGV